MIRKVKRLLIGIFVFFMSIIANVGIKILNFKYLISIITNDEKVEENELTPQVKDRLIFTLDVLNKIGRNVPWRVKCFEQAIIFLIIARVLKINMNIYFGIMKDESTKLQAHAWTSSGGYTWTGYEEAPDFTVVYIRGYKKS